MIVCMQELTIWNRYFAQTYIYETGNLAPPRLLLDHKLMSHAVRGTLEFPIRYKTNVAWPAIFYS
jgi:hypothetical protein